MKYISARVSLKLMSQQITTLVLCNIWHQFKQLWEKNKLQGLSYNMETLEKYKARRKHKRQGSAKSLQDLPQNKQKNGQAVKQTCYTTDILRSGAPLICLLRQKKEWHEVGPQRLEPTSADTLSGPQGSP